MGPGVVRPWAYSLSWRLAERKHSVMMGHPTSRSIGSPCHLPSARTQAAAKLGTACDSRAH